MFVPMAMSCELVFGDRSPMLLLMPMSVELVDDRWSMFRTMSVAMERA